MSARSQVTLWAQGGGVGEAVTDDQVGSPDRLQEFSTRAMSLQREAFLD